MSRGGYMAAREIGCRSALSPSRLYGYDYSLNPYRGCAHRCAYCYAPSIINVDREGWGRIVEVRRSMPAVLARELKRMERGVVGISTVTDPYQPQEERLELTRMCLKQLLRADWPVSILTKSPLVTRDIDLFTRFERAEVGITVTAPREDQKIGWEPHAPPFEERLRAVDELIGAGVNTYIFMGPLHPLTDPADIPEWISRIRKTGVGLVHVDGVNPKPGVVAAIIAGAGKRRYEMTRTLREDTSVYTRLMELVAAEADRQGLKVVPEF